MSSSAHLSLSSDLAARLLAFRDRRGWARYHNPKDLALSISIEAAELLECFQWSGEDLEAQGKRSDQAEELADVLIYAILLADRLGLNLEETVAAKLAKNEARYPEEKTARAGLAAYEALKAEARAKKAQARKRTTQTED